MATAELAQPSAADQAQALAALPPDYAILKLENDTIQALAAAKPRDHVSIRNEIAEQIEAYPSFAKAAIYVKPVGRDPETGEMKFARGLSIRAAEALAEAYGYCRIRTDVTPIDDDHVKVEATFTDYQKGRIWQDAGIVSKFYRDRYGKMKRIPDDRFYNVVVKAEVSRRVREVIVRSVPPGLRAELQEMAERKMGALLSGEGVQKIIDAFAGLGVSLDQLENHLGRTIGQGWTQEDRVMLGGLYNAIQAGETTVAEVFGDQKIEAKPPAEQENSSGTGPVTGDALTTPPPETPKQAATEPDTPDDYTVVMDTLAKCATCEQIDQIVEHAKGLGLTAPQQAAITRRANAKRRELESEAVGA